MKSISFVLTLLLSSALAAPFESTYSSLSAREEAGFFDDLKGGSLGPRASDDTVTKATDDLDKFLASLGGKDDVKVPSKREEALLGLDGLLDELLGGVTGGSGGVGGAAKGATDAVGGVTGDLTKELKEKLGDITGSAGGLTKDVTDKLDGLTGKGSDKQKREEALLGLDEILGLLSGLTGDLTGGSGAVGGITKGLTDTVGGATGGLTKELKEKLGDATGSAGDLTKDVTDKLDGLTGKGSDKQKREEAFVGDLLGLISALTGGVRGSAATGGLKDKLGDVTGSAGGLTKDVTDKLDGLTGKGSDKQKREEAIAGLPISIEDLLKILGLGKRDEALSKREEAIAGLPSIEDLLKILGLGKRDDALSKREEAIAGLPISIKDLLSLVAKLTKSGKQGLGKREEAIAGLPDLEDLLKILGLGKRDETLSKREEAIAGLPDLEDLLKILGLGKRDDALSKREEAIAGLPISIKDLLSLVAKLTKSGKQGLGKREEAIAGLPDSIEDLLKLLGLDQELSKREVAGIGRILSLNLLPLTKGSGKRDVAEVSSIDRRDPIALTPEIVEALLRQKLEAAKKGKDEIKDKASGKDKREVANHQALDDVTDEVKELLEALLGGAGKLPDSTKKTVEDKVGDVKDVAKDASGKAKDAVAAVDPSA